MNFVQNKSSFDSLLEDWDVTPFEDKGDLGEGVEQEEIDSSAYRTAAEASLEK